MKLSGEFEIYNEGILVERCKNLILLSGMNAVASRALNDCWKYCVAGISPAKNAYFSTGIEASQSGTTVTFSLPFSDLAVNSTIVWMTGEKAIVTGITDSTHVEVDRSQTVGSHVFTIYRTDLTSLVSEVAYVGPLAGGDNGYVADYSNRAITFFREWQFPVETSEVTYREIGLRWTEAAGSLFNRVVLPRGVTVKSGDRLSVKYFLRVDISAADVAFSLSIGSWGTVAGDLGFEGFGLAAFDGDGITGSLDAGSLEPSAPGSYAVTATLSDAHSFISSGVNKDYNRGALTFEPASIGLSDSYVTNSFSLTKRSLFMTAQSGIRSVILGRDTGSQIVAGARVLFDAAQSISSGYTFQLDYTISWDQSYGE
jgi:hypothetical protein